MGRTAEQAPAPDDTAIERAPTPGGAGQFELLAARGDVEQLAAFLASYRGDTASLIGSLHAQRGNGFVQAVLSAMPKGGTALPIASMPMALTSHGHSHMDQMRLDDAVNSAGRSLDGKDGRPTGAEAVAGLRALLNLPQHLMGEAVGKLSDAQFEHLLAEIPDVNKEELKFLVKATTDAGRKIQLWSVYHKAHVLADANRDPAGTDRESKRRHAAKVAAAKATAAEVDEETMFLAQQAGKTGKSFTAEDVDRLIERKDAEHAMEMKYNVNFTNQGGARADGTHIHWSKEELAALDKTMSHMPQDHVAGNAGLTEVRRQDKVFWDAAKTIEIGGIATGTQIQIGDGAAGLGPSGEKRQGNDNAGEDVSWMEWLTTHELGHIVGNKYSAAYDKYQKANGWKAHPKSTSLLTDAEKAVLDAKRSNDFTNRATVNKNGRTYQIDQDGTGYISRIQGSVPDGAESVPGDGGGTDPWGYARTRGHEQFAEHYDRATHVPEKVWKDLIETPHKATEAAQARFDAATTDAEKKQAKKQLDLAKAAEKARKQSFDVMRDEVFDTDAAQTAAEARLAAKQVDHAELVKFQEAAAKVSTPDQILALERKVPVPHAVP